MFQQLNNNNDDDDKFSLRPYAGATKGRLHMRNLRSRVSLFEPPPPSAVQTAPAQLSVQHIETWYDRHQCNKLSMRDDNWEAVTLFPPHCRDETLQTDVPITPNTLIRALNIDRREFNLLTKWNLRKKKAQWPKIHLPVTKWTLIFPSEENFLTDLLLSPQVN